MLIYKITSPTNKIYIGQTTRELRNRISEHKKDYKRTCKACPLYEDMKIYGFENFEFEIIQDNISSQASLDEAERYWISFYNTLDSEKGYNQDSGGKSGNTKSASTKNKIGESSKNKWKNEDVASKMLEGLRKGTETVKKNASHNFVKCVCEHCGKEFYLKPFESKNRKYCSIQCLDDHNKSSNLMQEISKLSAIKAHQTNVDNKNEIKFFILQWCSKHKDLVLNCPKNKISSTLSELFSILEKEYGFKDKRSYYLCFNVKSLKDFLTAIQNSI